MSKHAILKLVVIILTVVVIVSILTPALPVAADYYYGFRPSGSNYSQNDNKVVMWFDGVTHSLPARVDWYDPNSHQVSCSGGQGICWNQAPIAENGNVAWREYYLPIAGYNRPPGTYTAEVYSHDDGFFQYQFSANFSISGIPGPTYTPQAPTSTPTPTPYIPLFNLDPTFGSGGTVSTDFGSAAALQTDGKFVVAGVSNGDFALARYISDGSLDTSFGSGGKVTTDFGGDDYGNAVALQTDGKIVVAGTGDSWGVSDFALARYNSDGSLDTDFGSGGKVTTDFGGADTGSAVVVQTDGKILVAGTGDSYATSDFALARYNSDGSLDTGFGSGGKVTTDLGGTDTGSAAVMQANGKILVAGTSADNFALARYNNDGSLDTGFGSGGKVTTDFSGSDAGYAIAVQADGKIVVAGTSDLGGGPFDFALARYNSDGNLDGGFGVGGEVTTHIGEDFNTGRAIVFQPDGKIMVVGDCWGDSDFALARYNSDGSLDTGSGTGGEVIANFGHGYAATQQADGKLLVAGTNFLARYEASAVPPTQTATATMVPSKTPVPPTMTLPVTATPTSTPATTAKVFTSNGTQDGWVLETSERSNKGGTINSKATTFNLGDSAARQQYRSILSFNTGSGLPANAVISAVTLKLKKQAMLGGGNPVTAFQGLMVDIKQGLFGTVPLQAGDFQAAASKSYGPFKPALINGWYTIDLTGAIANINNSTAGSGLTQMRLRFKLDDNNNAVANILSLYSGNAPAPNRPQLIITYHIQ